MLSMELFVAAVPCLVSAGSDGPPHKRQKYGVPLDIDCWALVSDLLPPIHRTKEELEQLANGSRQHTYQRSDG